MLSTALLTDRYELTMLEAARRSGVAGNRAVFEVFARALPPGRRYGVVCGPGRLVDSLERFVFGDAELAHLESEGVVGRATLDWLAGFRFCGSIDTYAEGELYFPGSPVCTVEGTFGEAVLLETLILSILNFDSAVASAASRMVNVAGGRPIIEMGSRRTHEEAAVAAARAAYVAGFASTSNLEAARRYGLPTAGTASHAFTLAHRSESDAFEAQLEALGVDTTLLVDTFDARAAIRLGVELARRRGATGPGAIRLDSGDLGTEALEARELLDGLGAGTSRIVVTSDLDEFAIAALAGEPVDGYGVGTRVVLGSGAATAGFVYKLVAVADEPGPDAPLRDVAKLSVGKQSIGGRKTAWRELGPDGRALRELVVHAGTPAQSGSPGGRRRDLQVRYVERGERVRAGTVEESRSHHRAVLGELPLAGLDIAPGDPAVPVIIGAGE